MRADESVQETSWLEEFLFGVVAGFLVGGLAVLVGAALGAFSGCATAGPDLDLTCPVVVEVSGTRVGTQTVAVSPFEPLRVLFSEVLDADTVRPDRILIVASQDLGSCTTRQDCRMLAPGRYVRCIAGTCQASVADEAFVADAGSSSLSKARAAFVVPSLVDQDGRLVMIRPTAPLDADRLYDLVIAGTVTDQAANPLTDAAGHVGVVVHLQTTDPLASCVPAALVRPLAATKDVPTNIERLLLVAAGPVPWDLLDGTTLAQAQVPMGAFLQWKQVSCPISALVAALSSDATDQAWDGPVDLDMAVARSGGGGGDGVRQRVCYEAAVPGPLLSSVRYELRVPLPGQGPAVPGHCLRLAESASWFATGSGPREAGLEILQADLDDQGPCARLILGASVPVEWVVRAWPAGREGGGRPVWTKIWPGQAAMVSLGLETDLPDGPLGLVATATDLFGQTVSAGPLVLEPHVGLNVVITEVLANPAGSEPDQEFVELLNLGDEPVSLSGWALASSPSGDDAQTLSQGVIEPGGYALIVGPSFDPMGGADPAVAPGALVIHCDRNLTGNGLSNSGEPLYLLDGFGQVVCAYDRPLAVSGSRFNGVSAERVSSDLCLSGRSWQANPEGRSTPGGPNDSWR